MNDFDHIGDRIKLLRESKNITVKDLAEKSDVSSSLISQIEHEKVSPSLNTLKRILNALGETIISLVEMEKEFDKNKSLIKEEDRIKVIVAPGCIYEVLSVKNNNFSLFVSRFEPGYEADDFFVHDGIEAGIILKGKIELTIGESKVLMEKGDSITHSSLIPHRWKVVGNEIVEAIWVVSPPSF